MGVPFSACEQEIEYLCGYINDNGYIANYFGVHRDIVANVREKIKPRVRNHGGSLAATAMPLSDVGANASATMARVDAEIGSDKLRTAIEQLFRKFEGTHKLQAGAGQILLPAGWGGWK